MGSPVLQNYVIREWKCTLHTVSDLTAMRNKSQQYQRDLSAFTGAIYIRAQARISLVFTLDAAANAGSVCALQALHRALPPVCCAEHLKPHLVPLWFPYRWFAECRRRNRAFPWTRSRLARSSSLRAPPGGNKR